MAAVGMPMGEESVVRVLVTGAAGYVGSAVVAALARAGHEPVALRHRAATPTWPGVRARVGDLLEPGPLVQAVTGVDAVCHLAGLGRARQSWDEPLRYFQVNADGTRALLAAMESAGVERFVFASTASIYGAPRDQPITEDLPDDPPHPYAASKAAAEAVIEWQARTGRLRAVVLRLFNAAGGSDADPSRLIPRVLAVAAGEAPSLEVNGDGSARRDYLHVDDAAGAFAAAVDHAPPAGRIRRYNIGSGLGSSVLDVVGVAERVAGRPIRVVHRAPVAEPPVLVCDPGRALAELGWKPARSELDTIVRDAWAARPARQRG
ncbi:MAG TPA: NAD-dependent epimerase/dehydratase family protein [Mycobacteriales bacterium]|nr:NAD-dependent epimerase/dehydratase family protein [Mycobacteriales bacterium]